MTSLIKRIEAAMGRCRELDTLIFAEFYPKDFDAANGVLHVPLYTLSIDAAMTLVPEGVIWGVGKSEEGSFAGVGDQIRPVMGATPALALCAAALRARGVE